MFRQRPSSCSCNNHFILTTFKVTKKCFSSKINGSEMQQVVLLPSLRIIYKIIFKYVAGFVDQSVIFLKVSLICWVCYTFVNRGRAETCPTPATDHEDHKNCDWSAWSACYFLFSSFLRPVEVVEGEDVMKAVGKKWLNNLFLFSDTSCKRHLHREPSAHHDHHSLFLDKTTERR